MKQALAALFVAALLFTAGVFVGHYVWTGAPNYVVEKTKTHEIVYRVQPTKKAQKAKRKPLAPTICKGLTEIADPDLLAEYARRFGRPELVDPNAPHTAVLTDGMIPRCRWGGDVLVTATEGDDQVRVDFVPYDAPAFALRSDWSLRVGPVYTATEDDAEWGGLIDIDWRFAQTKKVDHGLTFVGIAAPNNSAVAVGYTLGFGNH